MPFYLRTGKRLGRRVTEIAVVFKRAPHLPFDATMTEELGQNAFVVRVQPDEGVTLRFGSKVPGSQMEVRDVTMDFGYGTAFTEASPEAYERLILDVLLGEPSLFPVNAEVERSWEILDPVLEHWADEAKGPDPYPAGSWGPESANAMMARTGTHVEAAMIVDLPSSTVSDVNKALVRLRSEGGVQALGPRAHAGDRDRRRQRHRGRDRGGQLRQPRAPVPGDRARARARRRPRARLDAQIRVGGDAGASDVIVLRGYGPLAADEPGAGMVMPLLLPDAPVVAWWPGEAPAVPSEDAVGKLAQRRITDALSAKNPTKAFEQRRAHHVAGDTDLTWTRLTPWRALLATALDAPPHDPVTTAVVAGEVVSPSTDLMAGWLAERLGVKVKRSPSTSRAGPGRRCAWSGAAAPSSWCARTARSASSRQPGQPDRLVALARREVRDCLAEELRRLDPDEIYGAALAGIAQDQPGPARRSQPGQ